MAEFKSQYPFVAFPSWILRKQMEEPGWLSAKEMIVLLALQSFADGMKHDQSVFPSIERLASMTSISGRSIIDLVKSLQEKGLIEKTRRYNDGERKTNIYTLKIWNYDNPPIKQLAQEVPEGAETLSAGSALNPDPTCRNRDPKCRNRMSVSAGSAPKQEPLNKNQELEPPLPPTGGESEVVGKRTGNRSGPGPLTELPYFAEPYRKYLESWWHTRWMVHKKRAGSVLTKQSLAALELANELKVIEEFCEHVSTKSWLSLGFAGYTDYLQKLARDKYFTPNTKQSSYQVRPPVDMDKHPSYRPLEVDDRNDFAF
jgi:DNA-binding MarR family transcriptional regulator